MNDGDVIDYGVGHRSESPLISAPFLLIFAIALPFVGVSILAIFLMTKSFALANAGLLWLFLSIFAAVFIIQESVKRLRHPDASHARRMYWWAIGICVASVPLGLLCVHIGSRLVDRWFN